MIYVDLLMLIAPHSDFGVGAILDVTVKSDPRDKPLLFNLKAYPEGRRQPQSYQMHWRRGSLITNQIEQCISGSRKSYFYPRNRLPLVLNACHGRLHK